MRSILVIGSFNIFLAIVWIFAPLKFYSITSGLFTGLSPPFTIGAIEMATVFLIIPVIILMLNGAALIILALKLEKVPELKVFSEKGEYVGRVKGVEAREGKFEKLEVKDKVLSKEDIAIKDVLVLKDKKIEKHEFIGKEVYTTKGQYLGKVESVSLDPEGNVSQFTTIKDGKKKVVQGEKINSSGEVILVSCFI